MSNTSALWRLPRLALPVVGLSILVFAACSQSPRQRYERKLADTGKPAIHAVHDEWLRQLMADLREIALEQITQEMEPGLAGGPKADEIADIAECLAETSREIPTVLQDVRLSSEDQRFFKALSNKLAAQALELAGLARQNEVPAMEAKLDEMISTCNACHNSFRILPVVKADTR